MARGTSQGGLVGAIRYDLRRLHDGWMALYFPRQRTGEHSVLGKWTPQSTAGTVAYRSLRALGALVVGLLYPFVLLGFAIRYQTRRIDRTAASLGVLGVVVLSLVVWGALTAVAWRRFSDAGVIAVAASGGVATVAAVLSYLTSRFGGRFTTVLFAYPFGMTAIFLPPVVAALYSPALSAVVFPNSESIAVWLLDNVLTYRNVDEYLRSRYDLEGLAYVGMWFGIAVPVGWVVGLFVSLANLVRPKSE
ncbi:hypothetical protein [Halomicrococcus sp. NG-SE-24]|uniref:hypothetical protein n=1 Tax=Halomicrococcus sp. NG-SE-24 TaxID=3436928 RepID=UPI003D996354